MQRKPLLRTLAVSWMLIAASVSAKTTFIANSFYDQQHPLSKYAYVEWADAVKTLSGGDLEAQVFTGTVLLAPRANLQGIRDNVAQVSTAAAMYTPSEMPIANALQELGFNYADSVTMILAVTDFSMNNPAQLAEWKKNRIVYLGGYTTPAYILMCRTPTTSLADLKGKRVRAAGAAISEWLEQAGAVPVNVPSTEMYTGLDRGSLDCTTVPSNDLIDRSVWEVAKHTTLAPTGIYWAGPHWGVNAKFWQGLTGTQREVLKEATARAMTRLVVQYVKSSERALDEARAKGNTIHQPAADLQASIEAFRSQRLAQIRNIAAEKYGMTDGAVIDDFIATHRKWEALLEGVDREDEAALAELALTHIYQKLPAHYGLE